MNRVRVLCSLCLFAASAHAQVTVTLEHPIPAPSVGAQFNSSHGQSVAVDEVSGYAVVAGPGSSTEVSGSGLVKVYATTTGDLLHTIRNPSPAASDSFGASVAISGTRLVIGTTGDDTGASNSGIVYVYDLGSAAPTVPVVVIQNPSPATGDLFGRPLAISGNRVIVGTTGDDTGASNAGSAYVYDLTSATPDIPAITLHNPLPEASDSFGSSVAIFGNRVIIGTRNDDTGASDAGSAYAYDLSSVTPTLPTVVFNNPFPAASDNFGASVAISGNLVAVAADRDDTGGTDAGSVYIYNLSSGNPGTPTFSLGNSNAPTIKNFGKSLAMSGTRLAVGGYSSTNSACAFAFDLGSGSPTTPLATFINPSPRVLDGVFGESVAISGTRVLVGDSDEGTFARYAGGAYLYNLAGTTPAQPALILNQPNPRDQDRFGYDTAISGSLLVIGAPYDGNDGSSGGSAFVYDLSSATPKVPIATLKAPNGPANDLFGYSVDISGTRVVVGAYTDDTGATDAGSAYIFDMASATSTVPIITLRNPVPANGEWFGYAVAIDGNRVLVGVPYNAFSGAFPGSAYVYNLTSPTPTVPVHTINSPLAGTGGFFGKSIAISGNNAVISSTNQFVTSPNHSGVVFAYNLGSATPTSIVATINNPTPGFEDFFGSFVAISGTRVVVGAPGDDPGASNAGSAYVFDLANATPATPVATLNNPLPENEDRFGSSVGIDGTRVVVGGFRDQYTATKSGRATLYDVAGANPSAPLLTLQNPSPNAGDHFGSGVAVAGDRWIIGAPGDDTVAYEKGHAYVYAITVAAPVPEIALSGNGQNITNGDVTPDAADGTAYGNVAVIGGSVTRTFTITNSGSTVLNLTGTAPDYVTLSGSSTFIVTTQPASPTVAAGGGTQTFQITFDPATIGPHTATISISSSDADENPFNFTVNGQGVTAEAAANAVIAAAGLTGNDALPTATPFNDGVENLLKYAFNMNLAGSDANTLPPGTGTSGLPSITTPEAAPPGTLRFEFLRRKGSGLVYAPQKSTTLGGPSWSPVAATPVVTSVNDQWERVVYTEAPDPVSAPACFGRVSVSLP